LEEPDSCVQVLDKARTIDPNNPQLSDIYYFAGYTYYVQKQNAKAASAWQTAIRLNPNNAQARNGLAVLGNTAAK
jgi:cytochrome c-type biogenesis protein CcmH/NrfG